MYGDPVYGENFFDREEILSLLERRLISKDGVDYFALASNLGWDAEGEPILFGVGFAQQTSPGDGRLSHRHFR
ncbi:MAG: hypothetical protein ACE5PV_26975 [Candidatus Poribacteria bacterium]